MFCMQRSAVEVFNFGNGKKQSVWGKICAGVGGGGGGGGGGRDEESLTLLEHSAQNAELAALIQLKHISPRLITASF